MFHSLERATAEANHIFSSDAHLLLYSGPALINGRWDPIGELLEASTLVTERMRNCHTCQHDGWLRLSDNNAVQFDVRAGNGREQ